MKKVVKLLVVILVSLLVCACLGVGGFYDVVVKTEEVQKPALSESLASEGEVPGSADESIPDDASETETPEIITITLGDFVVNLLHLGTIRDYLGIDVFKRILVCVAVGGAFIDGLLIAGLFRRIGRKSRKNHTDNNISLKDDSQAIEGYRVLRNVNGLKF